MDGAVSSGSTAGQVFFSQVIDINERTRDVATDGSFKSLLISPSTIENLFKSGFKKPSPVQMEAIPAGLTGFDMLVQAKSGTGKTLVFSILAIENLNIQSNCVQRLIVAPTREIAIQIGDTIQRIAHYLTKIAVLTGGTPVAEDREKLRRGVHVVVGTTGRVCQMIEESTLSLSALSLFVLDEADKMMSDSFEKDVNLIFSSLPPSKQVCVFSATYPRQLENTISRFMRSPLHIRLNADDVQLIGIKQYVAISLQESPIQVALRVLNNVIFNQALVFCTKIDDSSRVSSIFCEEGLDAASISSAMQQPKRDEVMRKLKSGKIKVLVSTDLTARGIDAENVNLVINLEPPFDVETYFHRIGRAARYGGHGASVSVLCSKKVISRFCNLIRDGAVRVHLLPFLPPPTLTTDAAFHQQCPPFIVNEVARDVIDDNSAPCHGSKKQKEDSADEEEKSREFTHLLQEAAMSSKRVQPKTESDEDERAQPVKAKFKFVPSRLKKGKKYYMRGEMLAIRGAATAQQWTAYARTKFNTCEEPFVHAMNEKGIVNKEKEKNEEKKKKATTASTPEASINTYRRKDMIAICKSKPAKVWREYTLSRWKTTEEPFVMESWKRCSMVEQLRRQREYERNEREKVVAERKAAAIRLISLGAECCQVTLIDYKLEEYLTRIRGEWKEWMIGDKPRRGPVVHERRVRHEYERAVEEATTWRYSFQRQAHYSLAKAVHMVREVEGQTEREGESQEKQRVVDRDTEEIVEEKADMQKKKSFLEEMVDETFTEEKRRDGVEDGKGDEKEEEEDDHKNLEAILQWQTNYFSNLDFALVYRAYLSTAYQIDKQ